MENKYVRKQFKTNQNILKTISCIGNANINNQCKFDKYKIICFTSKTLIEFVENDFV